MPEGWAFPFTMQGLNFNILLDTLPEAVIVVDSETHYVNYINKAALKFNNIASIPLTAGGYFPDMVSPSRKILVKQLLQSVGKEKTAQITEAEYADAKGKRYVIELQYSPVIHDGKVDNICVTAREITHEKVFEKRATQLLYDYSNLIENANAVIFSIDSGNYVTDWNAECSRVTGFYKNDVLAQQVEKIVHPSNLDEFKQFIAAVQRGEKTSGIEIFFQTSDTIKIHLFINATAKTNSHGKLVGILFVGHDITELSRYRRDLEMMVTDRTEKLKAALQKEKELVEIKNRFVSMASHELRIPLANISSSARFIRNQVGQDNVVAEKIDTIENQVKNMRQLIDDVLTMGKTQPATLKANHQPILLISFLEKIIQEVMVNAQFSHTVERKYSHPEIEIQSDEKLLRNVFLNLLSNAIKFSPDAKSIQLSVHQEDSSVVARIRDYGIGINPADLERIFNPFTRGTNVASISGTGLGMSIVRRAIEALNGSIEIDSKLNEGTLISVNLKM